MKIENNLNVNYHITEEGYNMVFIILNAIVTIVIELFEMLFYLWVKMKPN